MKKIGFDNRKYIEEQARFVLDRVNSSNGKLYVECLVKLLCDYDASVLLP